MRISVHEDIAAPAPLVFAEASDFASLERQALRRGAEVQRLDRLPAPGPGAAWRLAFPFRGRQRVLELHVTRHAPPTALAARVEGGGLLGLATADLLALSRGTTRVTLTLEVEGTTLASRLLAQSLRLGRGGIERRAEARLKAWARDVEARAARRRA